jgi:RNA polymerase sigma-70 factor (ECF subfamily)
MVHLDLELLERLRNQETTAFRELVEHHQDQVYGLCYKMINESHLAEDAAQEVFIKVYRNIRKYDGRAKLSTWIYRMAYNHCIDLLRKRKRNRTTDLEKANEIHAFQSQEMEVKRDHQQYWLHWAVGQLKEKDRALIHLFYIEESSIKEVSTILNLSENNVKVKLHRIREKLAELLKEQQSSIFEI